MYAIRSYYGIDQQLKSFAMFGISDKFFPIFDLQFRGVHATCFVIDHLDGVAHPVDAVALSFDGYLQFSAFEINGCCCADRFFQFKYCVV